MTNKKKKDNMSRLLCDMADVIADECVRAYTGSHAARHFLESTSRGVFDGCYNGTSSSATALEVTQLAVLAACKRKFLSDEVAGIYMVGASHVHAKIYSYVNADGLQKFLVCTRGQVYNYMRTAF